MTAPANGTPEPARDGGGAVGDGERLSLVPEVRSALAMFACRVALDVEGVTPHRASKIAGWTHEYIGRGDVGESAALLCAAVAKAARLRATPPAAGCASEDEGGYPCELPAGHPGDHRAIIGAHDEQGAIPERTWPSATPAPAGGDVAAAVGGEAVAALMEQHRSWCEMYGGFGASSPWSRDVGLLLTALTTERAAHEAAVRAVDICRTCDGEMIVECQHGVPGLEASTTCPTCDGTGKRVPDTEIQRLRVAAGDWEAERARAEALGAELMNRWNEHAESCMVCVPSLCDTDNVCRSWRPVFGLLQPAAHAAESAGGGA